MPHNPDFTALVPPGVRGLLPYVPGMPMGELKRRHGLGRVIKLASNENPLGPAPASLAALGAGLGDLARYPDGAAYELKQGLAAHLGVEPSCLTVGNGSNEILSIIAETFLGPDDEAVHADHAFLVYALAIQATGARARVAPANGPDREQPFGHSLGALAGHVGQRTRLVFIANPNNPTGTWLEPGPLREFIASLPPQVLVVLDEAYLEYMPDSAHCNSLAWLPSHPNLIVCRTFSKMHGLAGLRVGYAVSHPDLAELLNRVRQPFNVNALGQVAALAALGDKGHVARSLQANAQGMALLRPGLEALGWTVPPSAGNFLLADTGGPAGPWYDGLLRKGIIVRPVANYGLPRHLRITIGLPDENAALLEALAELHQTGVVV